VTYNNLTQYTKGRLVYFRSTDVEQCNYIRLLWSVPDEWLYLLSKGKKIVVKDKSSNYKGKIERIFIPALNKFLNYLYLGKDGIENDYHATEMLNAYYLTSSLRTKYKFWGGLITKPINIKAKTVYVKKEKQFKKEGMRKCGNASC
jgi:hypothetical protein